ncbi:MAG: hypothetical protein AAF997_04060 [Myxococcota bacterium]
MARLNPLTAFIAVAVLAANGEASADQTAVPTAPSDRPTTGEAGHDPWSYEIRAEVLPASYRWSRITEPFPQAYVANGSLYFNLGLGLRAIAETGHGILVDGAYRLDADFDGINAEESFPIRFSVGHVGYAFRYVGRRSLRDHRAWAITPHAALSAGVARKLAFPGLTELPTRSAVVGARIGVDFDLHVHRFFLGWSVSYEVLRHTKGVLTRSQFLAWNFIPILRIGVNFGRRVQR